MTGSSDDFEKGKEESHAGIRQDGSAGKRTANGTRAGPLRLARRERDRNRSSGRGGARGAVRPTLRRRPGPRLRKRWMGPTLGLGNRREGVRRCCSRRRHTGSTAVLPEAADRRAEGGAGSDARAALGGLAGRDAGPGIGAGASRRGFLVRLGRDRGGRRFVPRSGSERSESTLSQEKRHVSRTTHRRGNGGCLRLRRQGQRPAWTQPILSDGGSGRKDGDRLQGGTQSLLGSTPAGRGAPLRPRSRRGRDHRRWNGTRGHRDLRTIRHRGRHRCQRNRRDGARRLPERGAPGGGALRP